MVTLSAMPIHCGPTHPSSLRGAENEYQPYGTETLCDNALLTLILTLTL